MRRRRFVTLLGGAAVAWPLVLCAQQSTMPVIGFLSSGSPGDRAALLTAFRQGLNEEGYFEGRNVRIEYRWAEGHYDRLPGLAADLVRLGVTVLVPTAQMGTAVAAKAATSNIPIVFEAGGGDPVRLGLVASFNRPGGNVTGFTGMSLEVSAKGIELLRELAPQAAIIGVLMNPSDDFFKVYVRDLQLAAKAIGQRIEIVYASSEREIETAFTTFTQMGAGALLVSADSLFWNQRAQLVELAARNAIPTSHFSEEFARAGGLMSYAANRPDMYRRTGIYTGRVLKGANPGELPVQQPTKFDLIINLKTAKALGLTVPPSLLARADEVIE
jgi:putative ABC transport system substrate-binding protein